MLKLASEVLLPSLLQIINISLHTGVCPDVLKEARVFPVHNGGPSEDPLKGNDHKNTLEFCLKVFAKLNILKQTAWKSNIYF